MSLVEQPVQAELITLEAGLIELAEEEMDFAWSSELQAKMTLLPPRQRQMIMALVIAQIQGYPRSRFLLSDRSCQWCGHYSESKEVRDRHEAACPRRHGQPWKFVASRTSFYGWMKEPVFADCMQQAYQEATDYVLKDAFRFLKSSALVAAVELRRQVEQGRDEGNRQRAAIAILDRAGVETAAKSEPPRQLTLWLEELRAG